jgi:hypothetical protein
VTIIIQQQQVRFAARKAGEEMHLQVFDQSGELIYDSGAIVNAELTWPLQDGAGEAIKSGLYTYKLSIRDAGAETARVRRGHFIVDRAKDRDGNTDKLWVTSQGEGNVGAELTLARDENVAIAGTAMNNNGGERTTGQRTEITGRDAAGPTVETEAQSQSKPEKGAGTTAAAVVAGTVGQIAKFTTATDVGNSVITELGGNVGVGTTGPQNLLHVGPGRTSIVASRVNAVVASNNVDAGIAIAQNSGVNLLLQASSAGGYMGTTSNHPLVLRTNDLDRMVVMPNGNVGIATAPLDGYKLHVNGSALFGIGNGGDIAFGTPNAETGMTITRAGGRGDLRFEGSTLKLVAGLAGGPPASTAGIAINTVGNVGIGTVNPATKLHVESAGFAELAIKSTNERAILSLNNGLNPQGYVWTLESGVGGRFPSLFGIYNRTVNKSGLEIDGNLLVSVKALQITGGADFAENFDVLAPNNLTSKGAIEIQPGMVVAIDPNHPGKLNLSRRAYDRRVAGIISGAGDVKPGMMMKQEGTLADGKHPVALSGRVYVWVDAARGAIRPGDLLTTSATPGHAMKAGNPTKAQGAIIGKAMTGLKTGKGLVLVLVTLQ